MIDHFVRRQKFRQRGLSLVELMVTLVIGLVVTLVLFSTMQAFEGRRRTNISVNDINQAGSWAVYALDKWVRSAGSGFSQGSGETYGCTLTAAKGGSQILPRTAALPAPFDSIDSGTSNVFKLIPLLILPGQTIPSVSGKASDVLLIMGGSAGQGETAIQFSSAPTDTTINVLSTKGFSANDLVLVTDMSAAPTGTPCLIEQVSSGFAFSLSSPSALALNVTGDYYAESVNSTSLTSFTDTRNDAVINLGNTVKDNSPVFLVVGVGDDDVLVGFDLLQSKNPTSDGSQAPFPIADGIFEMHALYGIDASDDGIVDGWVEADGDYSPSSLAAGTSDALKRIKSIRAVRIGLIVRTSLPEKSEVANTTLTLFSDLGGSLTYTRSLSSHERHYRYKTIETTIPLRNPIMVSSR